MSSTSADDAVFCSLRGTAAVLQSSIFTVRVVALFCFEVLCANIIEGEGAVLRRY